MTDLSFFNILKHGDEILIIGKEKEKIDYFRQCISQHFTEHVKFQVFATLPSDSFFTPSCTYRLIVLFNKTTSDPCYMQALNHIQSDSVNSPLVLVLEKYQTQDAHTLISQGVSEIFHEAELASSYFLKSLAHVLLRNFALNNEATQSNSYDAENTNAMEQTLRQAVSYNTLNVRYQCILPVKREHGVCMKLIPDVEDLPLIDDLHEVYEQHQKDDLYLQVIEHLMEKAEQLLQLSVSAGENLGKIGISLSASFICDKAARQRIIQKHQSCQFDQHKFCIDIRPATKDINIVEFRHGLEELQENGISTALMEFGSKDIPLTNITDLPINIVKLDTTITQNISQSIKQMILVSGLVKIAHKLGILVVIEAIDNKNDFLILKDIGCDYMQGSYISELVTLDDIQQNCGDFFKNLKRPLMLRC